MAASTAKIDLLFKVSGYGWSEPYYHALADGQALRDLDGIVITMAKKRMKLCGGGVTLDEARLSDVAVRRDSDIISLNYFTPQNNEFPVISVPAGGTQISGALDSQALIPNVAVVVRVEGANKVYHSAHYLSGIPRSLVGADDRLISLAGWNMAAEQFQTHLVENDFLFPNLGREGILADRPVTRLDAETGVVTCDATDIVNGMRIRLINFHKSRDAVQRSAVGFVNSHTTTTFTYDTVATGGPNLVGWSVTPKSVAHIERTVYVPITSWVPDHVSHRNRGRPSDSPRGRRTRR